MSGRTLDDQGPDSATFCRERQRRYGRAVDRTADKCGRVGLARGQFALKGGDPAAPSDTATL